MCPSCEKVYALGCIPEVPHRRAHMSQKTWWFLPADVCVYVHGALLTAGHRKRSIYVVRTFCAGHSHPRGDFITGNFFFCSA